jgi:hypothetical protein
MMTRSAQLVRWVAFGLMATFGVVGSLFVAGETFADPGGWAAAGVTALWVVPMLGLVALALLRPEQAARVMVPVTVVVAVATVADAAFALVPRDSWGPVAAIVVFTTAVVLGFIGLHDAGLAGRLIVGLALAQLVSTVLSPALHGGAGGGVHLGGSSGVVVLPLLLVGALFLAADSLERTSHDGRHAPLAR